MPSTIANVTTTYLRWMHFHWAYAKDPPLRTPLPFSAPQQIYKYRYSPWIKAKQALIQTADIATNSNQSHSLLSTYWSDRQRADHIKPVNNIQINNAARQTIFMARINRLFELYRMRRWWWQPVIFFVHTDILTVIFVCCIPYQWIDRYERCIPLNWTRNQRLSAQPPVKFAKHLNQTQFPAKTRLKRTRWYFWVQLPANAFTITTWIRLKCKRQMFHRMGQILTKLAVYSMIVLYGSTNTGGRHNYK